LLSATREENHVTMWTGRGEKRRVRCHQHSIAETHAAFCTTTTKKTPTTTIIIIISGFLDRKKYDGRDFWGP
jgi:hypothetical protein